MCARKVLVAEAEPLGDALAEVLHEDVALGGELVHDLARLRLLQIERDTLLVAIVRLEVEVASARCEVSPPAIAMMRASGVALVALLDLDDLGAQVGEHRGRHRSLLPDRPIDDPDSFEWAFHRPMYTTTSANTRDPKAFIRAGPA